MSNEIQVKKINDHDDLQKAFAIRREVFVEEQNCPPELEYDKEEEAIHFLATVDGQAAGAARWRKTENGYKLERFAVLKTYRGTGVGQELVKAVLADLPTDASHIYLHAQVQAEPFYAKLGFKSSGPEFEEAGIRHYKMVYVLLA